MKHYLSATALAVVLSLAFSTGVSAQQSTPSSSGNDSSSYPASDKGNYLGLLGLLGLYGLHRTRVNANRSDRGIA